MKVGKNIKQKLFTHCKGGKSLEGYERKNCSLIVKEKKIGGEITKFFRSNPKEEVGKNLNKFVRRKLHVCKGITRYVSRLAKSLDI
jgi:hypothetical protein